MLGYDVEAPSGTTLAGVFRKARSESRIVLTLSRRRPPTGLGVTAVIVPRTSLADQVRLVAARFTPAGPPFSRCAACNHRLEARTAEESSGRVPPHAHEGGGPFHHCPGCGRWYWPGTHVARMREWLAAVVGYQIPRP